MREDSEFCCSVLVLKCIIKPEGHNLRQRVNICIGMTEGSNAVPMFKRYMQAMPPLQSLVLVIKSMLKVAHISKMGSCSA